MRFRAGNSWATATPIAALVLYFVGLTVGPQSYQGFLLTLSLAEVAPAVEKFNQPTVIDGFDFKRFVPVHD